MIILFWISVIFLVVTFFGYPILVALLAKTIGYTVKKDLTHQPNVSVVFSVYNEEKNIYRKLRNLLDSEYPADRIEILVGSDGSTDQTNQILSCITDKRVHIFIFKDRRGKPSVLNDLTRRANGEILIFCDTRQIFDKYAISNLIANFADIKVGCVSGEMMFSRGGEDTGVADSVDLYWSYEKFIRKNESAIHSMTGATGAIYAIRKKLYSPMPVNTVLDDVYIPLTIARKGYRCIWDPKAKAYDRPAFAAGEEYRRKVRTLAGNYQIFSMFKDLLIPFRCPASLSFILHKFLRVLAPFFMVSAFVSNIFIADRIFYAIFLIAQILFYITAIVGIVAGKQKNNKLIVRIASAAYMFCFLNFISVVALYKFLFGKQKIAWEK